MKIYLRLTLITALISFFILSEYSTAFAQYNWSTSSRDPEGFYDISSDGGYIYYIINRGGFRSESANLIKESLNAPFTNDTTQISYGQNCTWFKVSVDMKYCALAFSSGTIEVWDLEQKAKLHTITSFTNADGIRFSQFRLTDDSKSIVCLLLSDSVRVQKWDIESGLLASSITLKDEMQNFNLTFSQNGKYLVLINSDNIMKGYEVSSGQELFNIHKSDNFLAIISMGISNDGKFVAFNDNNPRMQVYNATTNSYGSLYRYYGFPNTVFQFIDNNTIITDSKDTLVYYNCTTGEIRTVPGALSNLYKLQVKYVPVTGNSDKGVFYFQKQFQPGAPIWKYYLVLMDLVTPKEIKKIPNAHLESVRHGDISPDGTLVLSYDDEYKAFIWDALSGNMLGKIDDIVSPVFSPVGNKIIYAVNDSLFQYNYQTKTKENTWAVNKGIINKILRAGDNLIIASTPDKIVALDFPQMTTKFEIPVNSQFIMKMRISGDLSELIVLDTVYTLSKYSLQTGQLNSSSNIKDSTIYGSIIFDISPDGNYIAYNKRIANRNTFFILNSKLDSIISIFGRGASAGIFAKDNRKMFLFGYQGDSNRTYAGVYNFITKAFSCENRLGFSESLPAGSIYFWLSTDELQILSGTGFGMVSYGTLCDLFVSVPEENNNGNNDSGNDLSVSPNPAVDFINLSDSELDSRDKVRIYSIEGVLQLETDYRNRINVSKLTPGVYIIKSGAKTLKFLKY
ncbi:MAG: T9SS type A sorting domain-containing protein [Bacteroidota bacterium]